MALNPGIRVGGVVGRCGGTEVATNDYRRDLLHSSDCAGAGLACYIVRWLRAVTRTLLQRTTSTRHEPGLNIAQLLPCEKEGKGMMWKCRLLDYHRHFIFGSRKQKPLVSRGGLHDNHDIHCRVALQSAANCQVPTQHPGDSSTSAPLMSAVNTVCTAVRHSGNTMQWSCLCSRGKVASGR